MKKTKKLLSMAISVLTFSAILFTMNTSVLADVALNISTQTTRITGVPNTSYNGETCTNMGGLAVTSSSSDKDMYVVKSSSSETEAVLYFYDDCTATSSNYGKFELKNLVGHANAMAIDDNYIYITCWKSSDETGAAKNDILRISRTRIKTLYNNTTAVQKGTLTSGSTGCTVFSAVTSSGAEYTQRITAITKYKENGKFIINYGVKSTSSGYDVVKYTTASISSGKFVVSNSAADVFTVNTGLTNTTGQDIGYSPSCGLFIARWLPSTGTTSEGNEIRVKNTIVWIKLNSLSGNNRTYTKDNSKFRHIIVNKSTSVFSKYEIESISFDYNNDMYVSVNTYPTSTYNDGIIRVRRATATSGGSYKFLGSNIDE